MSNSRTCTSLMFLTAVSIIIGGWLLTERLLTQREEKFLGSTGKVAVRSEEIGLLDDSSLSDAQEQETEREAFQGQKMSGDTRALVLAVWEYGGKELPHEPMAGQMDMKQAIDAGKEWIAMMARHGVFTDVLQECDFDAIKAELCSIDTPIRTSMEEALYSYWNIWCIKDGASVELTIHAASGEVWRARICVETGEKCVEIFDREYWLQYAFPFMEAGTGLVWVEAYDLEAGEPSVNVVKMETKTVFAEARQYQIQTNEEPARAVLEFALRVKE